MSNVWVDTSATKIPLAYTSSQASGVGCWSVAIQISSKLSARLCVSIPGPASGLGEIRHEETPASGGYCFKLRSQGTDEQEKATLDVLAAWQRRELTPNVLRFVFD